MFWISNCALQSLCPEVHCDRIHIYKQCSSASSSERGRQCHIYVRNIFVSSPKWGLRRAPPRLSLSNHTSRVTQIVQARHPVLFYAHTKTLCIGWDVIVQYTQIPIPINPTPHTHTTQAEPPLDSWTPPHPPTTLQTIMTAGRTCPTCCCSQKLFWLQLTITRSTQRHLSTLDTHSVTSAGSHTTVCHNPSLPKERNVCDHIRSAEILLSYISHARNP